MIRASSTFSSLASVLTDKGTSRDETSNLEVFVKKVLLIGSAALVVLMSSVPDAARGAPVGQPAIAQLVPAAVQDVAQTPLSLEIIASCSPYNEKVPIEFVGTARSCDDVQEVVVANTEKVSIAAGSSARIARSKAAHIVVGAVETKRLYHPIRI